MGFSGGVPHEKLCTLNVMPWGIPADAHDGAMHDTWSPC